MHESQPSHLFVMANKPKIKTSLEGGYALSTLGRSIAAHEGVLLE